MVEIEQLVSAAAAAAAADDAADAAAADEAAAAAAACELVAWLPDTATARARGFDAFGWGAGGQPQESKRCWASATL